MMVVKLLPNGFV